MLSNIIEVKLNVYYKTEKVTKTDELIWSKIFRTILKRNTNI